MTGIDPGSRRAEEQKLRILVVDASPPFHSDGVLDRLACLETALQRLGHEVDPVRLPSPVLPGEEDEAAICAAGLVDLTETYGLRNDLVIASGFPACLVHHPRKLVWRLRESPGSGPLAAMAREALASCVVLGAGADHAPPDPSDADAWERLAQRLIEEGPELGELEEDDPDRQEPVAEVADEKEGERR